MLLNCRGYSPVTLYIEDSRSVYMHAHAVRLNCYNSAAVCSYLCACNYSYRLATYLELW